MNYYKIIVSYDGTDYLGWQFQPHVKTIVGTLCKTFFHIFNKECEILGSSRTDAGVHAYGQIARVITEIEIEPEKLQTVWNNSLPPDIVIRSVELSSEQFHPMTNILEKTYWYHVFPERPLPFFQRFGWYFYYPFELEKFKEGLKLFVGTHDFRSFCTGYEKENTVRTINSITVTYIEELKAYRIEVKGKGFLRHMIRRIIGACLEVSSREKTDISLLQKILAEKNPNQNLVSAAGKGLLLYTVQYKINI